MFVWCQCDVSVWPMGPSKNFQLTDLRCDENQSGCARLGGGLCTIQVHLSLVGHKKGMVIMTLILPYLVRCV